MRFKFMMWSFFLINQPLREMVYWYHCLSYPSTSPFCQNGSSTTVILFILVTDLTSGIATISLIVGCLFSFLYLYILLFLMIFFYQQNFIAKRFMVNSGNFSFPPPPPFLYMGKKGKRRKDGWGEGIGLLVSFVISVSTLVVCDSSHVWQVVPAWLNCLPITGDLIEAKVVHEQLCSMVER